MVTSTVPITRARSTGVVVRPVTRAVHARFVHAASTVGQVSFLQSPSWADVKPGWRAAYFGWFDGGEQIGGALVLLRSPQGIRRFFAYVPEGPILDWSRADVGEQLALLVENLQRLGAFAVRIGPPLAHRQWTKRTVDSAIAPGRTVADVVPDTIDPLAATIGAKLRSAGWRQNDDDRYGGDVQPRHVFTVPLRGRDENDLWNGLNQAWRRQVRRARREHVVVTIGTEHELPTFFDLLQETENRNGFRLGRSLEYFQRQYRALNKEELGRIKLFLAWHHDRVVAAHTLVTLGARAWYLNGASATDGRALGPGYALQWEMIRAAHAGGAEVYDMRGVPTSLDPDDPAVGLLRWKLGAGGTVVETLGEWEIPLPGATNRLLRWAVRHRRIRR